MNSESTITFWPFMVYAGIAVALAVIMIGLSYVLGERHKEKKTDEPFESGIPPTGNARLRFSSHFFLIAMFFVIFDLDAAFIVAYAISFRHLGLEGYLGIAIFIAVLMIVLIYELSIGALDYGPNGKKLIKLKNNAE